MDEDRRGAHAAEDRLPNIAVPMLKTRTRDRVARLAVAGKRASAIASELGTRQPRWVIDRLRRSAETFASCGCSCRSRRRLRRDPLQLSDELGSLVRLHLGSPSMQGCGQPLIVLMRLDPWIECREPCSDTA